jgi:hypothetical protein
LGLALRLALALAFMAPLFLGPALGPLTRALGGVAEHLCACGMVPGTCGCPECELLERQRQLDHTPRPYPTLKSQCNDGEIATGFPALPPAVPPAAFILPALPPRLLAGIGAPPSAHSRDPRAPPTPPPRV